MDPKLKEAIDKVWPRTKVELEKAARTTKLLIDRGEVEVRKVSKQGFREVKKLSLTLKKDALYFRLGKSVATTAAEEWGTNRKIHGLLREIKVVEKNLKSVSKKQPS